MFANLQTEEEKEGRAIRMQGKADKEKQAGGRRELNRQVHSGKGAGLFGLTASQHALQVLSRS